MCTVIDGDLTVFTTVDNTLDKVSINTINLTLYGH